MQTITIPNYADLQIEHVVLDYNGTLASGGILSEKTRRCLKELTGLYHVYVITADTFGTVKQELEVFDLEVIILSSSDHTSEKSQLIERLGAVQTAAMGNGNNDRLMLERAALSVALMGSEGCAVETMHAADILCGSIVDAMELLIYPKRLVATLRR
jgi:soluble P-type ATPase